MQDGELSIAELQENNVEEYEDDYLDESDKSWTNNKNIVEKTKGNQISFDYVYKKIAQIIDTGNSTLEVLQAIDPDESNPATLGATASLINSIRACISEFTKIHLQYIKFQNAVKMEEIKHKNKKDIIRFRKKVSEGKDVDDSQQTELIEVKSGDIYNYLQYQKEKEEENK